MTAPDELLLIGAAQAGDRSAMAALLQHHAGLIRRCLPQIRCPASLDFEELAQAGRIALWRAIQKYRPSDPPRRLSTFATHCILRAMWRVVADFQRSRMAPLPREPLCQAGQSPAGPHSRPAWSDLERQILELRFGPPRRSWRFIADRLGISPQSARSILQGLQQRQTF